MILQSKSIGTIGIRGNMHKVLHNHFLGITQLRGHSCTQENNQAGWPLKQNWFAAQNTRQATRYLKDPPRNFVWFLLLYFINSEFLHYDTCNTCCHIPKKNHPPAGNRVGVPPQCLTSPPFEFGAGLAPAAEDRCRCWSRWCRMARFMRISL